MNAVVIEGKEAVIENNVPLPEYPSNYILVKSKAMGGNPTDWKHIEYGIGPQKSIVGCDVSGEIVSMGQDVDTTKFHIGDYVFSFAHGTCVRKPDNGAFADYVALDSELTFKLPKNTEFSNNDVISEGKVISFEEAASIPLSWFTAGGALFHEMKLKYDCDANKPQNNFPLLVWGGGSALGQAVIQLAKKYHGYTKIISVASRKHEKQLLSYGADEVFDYHDSDVITQIKNKYNNIQQLFDCVSTLDTLQQVYQCAPDSLDAIVVNFTSKFINDIKPELRRANVNVTRTVVYLSLGYDVFMAGNKIPADPQYKSDMAQFTTEINPKILNGEFHHPPIVVYKNGLQGAIELTRDIQNGVNEGKKLVATFR
ncbi:similar to Saccharomyces cerevisiae YCR102C Putative protein of unknown function, involved in copper metabolism [Maudiozyma saulgeensis]|uniref:Enoyl reductase (ER) domain-containing protein n=1 Tax=Maudiozyma saulgeensis TaxID=1789683 RepID=A0A1X7RC89_9SACH|nr:similar to Saccharomyces cerevisiae YCR102C Putative protein of unknown function, involved in copper metabolism [Kazachstania saulgeensis]